MRAPRPFEHDDVGVGKRGAHERYVVIAGCLVAPMDRRYRRLAARQALDAGSAAAGKNGEPACRCTRRPLEQRVVASRDDRRPFRRCRTSRFRREPRVDLPPRKQQLAGGAHMRDGVQAREIVDATFFQAQIRRHFACIHHLRRGR